MLHPLRCVRFGEVLLDENLRTFLLCTSCHAEYASLQQFGAHFRSSPCGSAFFTANNKKWPTENVTRCKRHLKGQQQYLVYNLKELTLKTSPTTKVAQAAASTAAAATATNAQAPVTLQVVKSEKDDDYLDLLKIEEELLDPRWYTDLEPTVDATASASATPSGNQMLAYSELVEAVTPYVQFKENVRKYPNKNAKVKKTPELPATKAVEVQEKVRPNQQPIASNNGDQATAVNRKNVGGARVLHPTAKRCLIMEPQSLEEVATSAAAVMGQQQRQHAAVPTSKQYIVQVIDDSSQQATPSLAPAVKRRKTTIIPLEQFQNQLADMTETNSAKALPEPRKMPTIAQAAKPKEQLQQTRSVPQKPQMLLNSKTAAPTAAVAPMKASIQQSNAIPKSTGSVAAPATASSRPPPSVKQTEQILTKLQTLGLQVKRTQPASGSSSVPQSTKIDETLELLKKLQSKGMKVKVVNKDAKASAVNTPTAPGPVAVTPKKKPPKPAAALGNHVAVTLKTKTAGLGRNLIIKKVK